MNHTPASVAPTHVAPTVRFDPLVPPHRDTPELAYQEFLDAGVSWCPELDMYVVARRADVMRVLHDPDTFSSAAALPPIWDLNPPEVTAALRQVWPRTAMVIETDGQRHRTVRQIYLPALSPPRIRAQKERMLARAHELVTTILAGRTPGGRVVVSVDLRRFAGQFVADVVNAIIGLPHDDADEITAWTSALVALWSPGIPVDAKLDAVATLGAYRESVARLIAHRRAQPHRYKDLIADLLRGEPHNAAGSSTSGGLIDDEIVANVLGSRIAGLDTTRDTITSTARLMLEHGSWREAGQAHRRDRRRLINRCRQEALRRYTPHRGLCRVTTRQVKIGDSVLPAGAVLLISFGAANLDPAVFPDPLAVDIDRPNLDQHVAFGLGPHACGGKGLALTEINTALDTLVSRLPHLELADTAPTYAPSIHFYGLDSLNVHIGNDGTAHMKH